MEVSIVSDIAAKYEVGGTSMEPPLDGLHVLLSPPPQWERARRVHGREVSAFIEREIQVQVVHGTLLLGGHSR